MSILKAPKSRMKVIGIAIVVLLLLNLTLIVFLKGGDAQFDEISISDVLGYTSTRNPTQDVVIVSDDEPLFGLIATPLACWYDIGTGESGLKPLLVAVGGELEAPQQRFLTNYGQGDVLTIGDVSHGGDNVDGTIFGVSVEVAQRTYLDAAGALVLETDQDDYDLGVLASPVASYLNIPVIVKDEYTSAGDVKDTLEGLNAKYIITLGDDGDDLASSIGYRAVVLDDIEKVQKDLLEVIEERFGMVNYLTLTNPGDVIPPYVLDTSTETISNQVNNIKLDTANGDIDVIGESLETFDIEVGEGINRVQIYINFTNVQATALNPLKEALDIEPIIFGTLYDPQGRIVCYAPSFSYETGKDYMETQVFDLPGTYRLEVSVYYGTSGFKTYAGTSLGVSRIEASYDVSVVTSHLERPHLPLYEKLSMMAPYLTAAHGGIVMGEAEFEVTDEAYGEAASGYGTGPWYEKDLLDLPNQKVDYILKRMNDTMGLLESRGLYESYMSGPAWLALLGGPNMIPQYYEAKEESWVEENIYGVGWPTDNVYSIDLSMSLGRVLGRDVGDVSTLIARTLFYEEYVAGHDAMIKQQYGSDETWGSNFHFLAGEMGGRTGWFFWQRGFAPEVEQAGFNTEEYFQDVENDRQSMVMVGAYERANYFDLMMHGNWYWYVPELNGLDSYSTGVKVSDQIGDIDDWELGPSMMISGVCLLGRIDGIAPSQSITMSFLHSGINSFFTSSRSTGSESKAGTVERALVFEDFSVGEAWRADKNENQEPAAFYVRILFADPAFNPYEPGNGFSDQGRPVLRGVSGSEEGSDEEGSEDVHVTATRSGSTTDHTDDEYLQEAPSSESITISTESDQTKEDTSSGSSIISTADISSYNTYESMVETLNDLNKKKPQISKIYNLGNTYEGRTIWAMKISDNVQMDEDEPEILFTGAHHGREWPSYEVPLHLMTYIIENYGEEPTDNDGDGAVNEDPFDGEDNDGDGATDEDESEDRITFLVDNREIWIIPMVNPDGVSYAHKEAQGGSFDENTLWRKNREPNMNPLTGSAYPEEVGGRDMWGTDLNRNYGFHWGEVGYQGYADPSREDYIGPLDKTDEDNDRNYNEDPMDGIDNDGDGKIDEDVRGGFSTAETRAIKRLVEEHDFVLTLNFHTYGGKIFWPWMWTLELTPDEELYTSIARDMNRFNGYEFRDMDERNQGTYSRHPPVDGDSNDWLYGVHGILAYTIELGTQFIPPYEEAMNICEINLGANLLAIEIADNPWRHYFSINHTPLDNTTETDGYIVTATVDNPFGIELRSQGLEILYSIDGGSFTPTLMESAENPDEFMAYIPGQAPGTKISYFICATDVDNRSTLAPRYAPYAAYTFQVRETRGDASSLLLITHVIFIMGAIVFVILAAFYSLKYLLKGVDLSKSIKNAGIAWGMIFIGGFPLGWALAYQVYGTPWTGIPFGWDITDNKTLIIFFYWSVALYMIRGTAFNLFASGRGKWCPFRMSLSKTRLGDVRTVKGRRDMISKNRFAKLTIIGALLTISLYLIPHSIMVSPWFSITLFALVIFIFIMPVSTKMLFVSEEPASA